MEKARERKSTMSIVILNEPDLLDIHQNHVLSKVFCSVRVNTVDVE